MVQPQVHTSAFFVLRDVFFPYKSNIRTLDQRAHRFESRPYDDNENYVYHHIVIKFSSGC